MDLLPTFKKQNRKFFFAVTSQSFFHGTKSRNFRLFLGCGSLDYRRAVRNNDNVNLMFARVTITFIATIRNLTDIHYFSVTWKAILIPEKSSEASPSMPAPSWTHIPSLTINTLVWPLSNASAPLTYALIATALPYQDTATFVSEKSHCGTIRNNWSFSGI